MEPERLFIVSVAVCRSKCLQLYHAWSYCRQLGYTKNTKLGFKLICVDFLVLGHNKIAHIVNDFRRVCVRVCVCACVSACVYVHVFIST